MANLRAARLLSLSGIRRVPLAELERLIRSSGYFRQKAARLKRFVAFLDKRYAGSLTKLLSLPTDQLREELLNLNGVGPETADSILLYAGNHPVFVVDAYTRRILVRHEILAEEATYEEIRELFEQALAPKTDSTTGSSERSLEHLASDFYGAGDPSPHPPSAMSTARRTALTQVYNEMHGLIVGVGKNYCRKSQPRCDQCPLQKFLPRV